MVTIIEKLEAEKKALTDRLRRAERFDQWQIWSHENELRLAEIIAELKKLDA